MAYVKVAETNRTREGVMRSISVNKDDPGRVRLATMYLQETTYTDFRLTYKNSAAMTIEAPNRSSKIGSRRYGIINSLLVGNLSNADSKSWSDNYFYAQVGEDEKTIIDTSLPSLGEVLWCSAPEQYDGLIQPDRIDQAIHPDSE